MHDEVIHPRPLRPGDTVAIVSPASVINPDFVTGAKKRLEEQGFKVRVGESALAVAGSYAGSPEQRLEDMRRALADDSVRAILCSRGGYGCVHLLEGLEQVDVGKNPKWLIGFSDVSALHAFMASKGVVSVHGSMAKALALNSADFEPNRRLFSLLRTGSMQPLTWAPSPFNRPGEARGRLLGGNLAVIQALVSTPYNVFSPGSILFIEDIAEPIYKIERMLWQLRLSGTLKALAGLIVGRFTEYTPDKNFSTMEEMIVSVLGHADFPVAFDAPIGHIDDNMPLMYNSLAQLSVSPEGSSLSLL